MSDQDGPFFHSLLRFCNTCFQLINTGSIENRPSAAVSEEKRLPFAAKSSTVLKKGNKKIYKYVYISLKKLSELVWQANPEDKIAPRV